MGFVYLTGITEGVIELGRQGMFTIRRRIRTRRRPSLPTLTRECEKGRPTRKASVPPNTLLPTRTPGSVGPLPMRHSVSC